MHPSQNPASLLELQGALSGRGQARRVRATEGIDRPHRSRGLITRWIMSDHSPGGGGGGQRGLGGTSPAPRTHVYVHTPPHQNVTNRGTVIKHLDSSHNAIGIGSPGFALGCAELVGTNGCRLQLPQALCDSAPVDRFFVSKWAVQCGHVKVMLHVELWRTLHLTVVIICPRLVAVLCTHFCNTQHQANPALSNNYCTLPRSSVCSDTTAAAHAFHKTT